MIAFLTDQQGSLMYLRAATVRSKHDEIHIISSMIYLQFYYNEPKAPLSTIFENDNVILCSYIKQIL